MEGPCFTFGIFLGVILMLCIDVCVDADRWGLPYPVVAIVNSKVWMYTAHGRVPLCRREVRANLVPDNSK